MREVWCFRERRRQYPFQRGTGETFSHYEVRKKVPRLHAFVFLVRAMCRRRSVRSFSGKIEVLGASLVSVSMFRPHVSHGLT
jgi:hypothetical protein